MRAVDDEERADGEQVADGERVAGEDTASPIEVPELVEVTRAALLAVLNDPEAMAPVKLAATELAGGRGPDVADDLLADVVGDTWAGDSAWDPAGAMPGVMQGHLIAAMQFRAKEMYRRESRIRSLTTLPEDHEPATHDGPDPREVALAARLDRLPRLLPRLREQLQDDPEASGTLSLFEAGMGRAQLKCAGSDLSPRQLRRRHDNARRRVRRAALMIDAELVAADAVKLANNDAAPSRNVEQAPEGASTATSAMLNAHLRTRRAKREPATLASGPSVRKRRKRST